PAFIAVGAVGNQTEISEEGVDVLAVGDGAGRGRAVALVQLLPARPRYFAPPEDLAGDGVEAEYQQLLTLEGGEKNVTVGEDGGGVAGRERGLPDDVLLGAEFGWDAGGFRNAGGVGSAELRPLGASGQHRSGEKCKRTYEAWWGGPPGPQPAPRSASGAVHS